MQDANDRGWLFTKSADGKVEGPNLRAISTCALQIAEGMDYLHEKGCMHRDLTASNVLLASDKSFPWGFSCKARPSLFTVLSMPATRLWSAVRRVEDWLCEQACSV